MDPGVETTQEFQYQICKTKESIDSIDILEYGIICKNRCNITILSIECISTEYDFVAQLVHRLNEGKADACHLYDIVEDALC